MKKTLILIIFVLSIRCPNCFCADIIKSTTSAILKTDMGKESMKKVSDFSKKNLFLDTPFSLALTKLLVTGDISYKTKHLEFKIEPFRQESTLSFTTDF